MELKTMSHMNILASQIAIFTFFWIFKVGLAFPSLPSWKQMAKLSHGYMVAAGAHQAQSQSIIEDSLAALWLMRSMFRILEAV